MSGSGSRIVCLGCETALPPEGPYPFSCPAAGRDDGIEHIVRPIGALRRGRAMPTPDDAPNPFQRYRDHLHSYHMARSHGLSDEDYIAIVGRVDARVRSVCGRGFRVTPFERDKGLSAALGFLPKGGVWVKDETENVAGSHKARHLMGLALYLKVAEATSRIPAGELKKRRFVIASCGNAALAAAVVAKAMDWQLTVMIPPSAEPVIVGRLNELGAVVEICPREDSSPGDPCYKRFLSAVAEGALPFSCDGRSNGLSVEGCETIGYEIMSEMRRARRSLRSIFVQVGGGALGSAVAEAVLNLRRGGAIRRPPSIISVQTECVHPFVKAWRQFTHTWTERYHELLHAKGSAPDWERVRASSSQEYEEHLHYAASHRAEFMCPWESEPRSAATGILDDETYSWLPLLWGTAATRGRALTVSEDQLLEANELARSTTGINVSVTGSAGLAGLIRLREQEEILPDENVAVLFTGVER